MILIDYEKQNKRFYLTMILINIVMRNILNTSIIKHLEHQYDQGLIILETSDKKLLGEALQITIIFNLKIEGTLMSHSILWLIDINLKDPCQEFFLP